VSISTLIATVPLVYLLVIATPLITIDLRQHRLPNKFVYPLISLALISNLVSSWISGEWFRFGIAFAVAFGIGILGMVANHFDYLGMGDVKLLFGTSLAIAWFSWWLALVAVVATLICGIVFGFVLVSLMKRKVNALPLGVWSVPTALVVGSLAVLTI